MIQANKHMSESAARVLYNAVQQTQYTIQNTDKNREDD